MDTGFLVALAASPKSCQGSARLSSSSALVRRGRATEHGVPDLRGVSGRPVRGGGSDGCHRPARPGAKENSS